MVDVANLTIKIDSKDVQATSKHIKALANDSERLAKSIGEFNKEIKAGIGDIRKNRDVLKTTTTAYGALATTLNTRTNVTLKTFARRLESANREAAKIIGALDNVASSSAQTGPTLQSLAQAAEASAMGLDHTEEQAISAAHSVEELGDSARRTTGRSQKLAQSASNTGNKFKSLGFIGQRLQATLAVMFSFQLIQQITQYTDQWIQLENFMLAVSDTSVLAQKRIAGVADIARAGGAELATVGTAFNRFRRATENLNLSDTRLLQYVETIVKAGALSGTTAHELNGAMRQLSQAFQAGALRGDEFNSVAEQMPLVINSILEVLETDRGALREYAATGAVDIEILVNAFERLGITVEEEWEKVSFTIGQRLAIAQTNIKEFTGSAGTTRSTLTFLADAVIFATRAFPGFAAATALASASLLAFGTSLFIVGAPIIAFAKPLLVLAGVIATVSAAFALADKRQEEYLDSFTKTETQQGVAQYRDIVTSYRRELEQLEVIIKRGEAVPEFRGSQAFIDASNRVEQLRTNVALLTDTQIELNKAFNSTEVQLADLDAQIDNVVNEMLRIQGRLENRFIRKTIGRFGLDTDLKELQDLLDKLIEQREALTDEIRGTEDLESRKRNQFVRDFIKASEGRISILRAEDEAARRLAQAIASFDGELSELNVSMLRNQINLELSAERWRAIRDAVEANNKAIHERLALLKEENRISQLSERDQFIRETVPEAFDLVRSRVFQERQARRALHRRLGREEHEQTIRQYAADDAALESIDLAGQRYDEAEAARLAKEAEEALAEARKRQIELAKQQEKQRIAARKNVEKVLARAEYEIRLLKATGDERLKLIALQQLGILNSEDQVAASDAEVAQLMEYLRVKEQIAEAERKAAEEARELERMARRTAQQIQRDWERVRDTLSDTFRDALLDGENAFDSLAKAANRAALSIISDFAANGVLSLLGATFPGVGSGIAGTGAQGAVGVAGNAFIAGGASALGTAVGPTVLSAIAPNATAGLTSAAGLLAEGAKNLTLGIKGAVFGANTAVAPGTLISTGGAGLKAGAAALVTNPIAIAGALLVLANSQGFFRNPDGFTREIAGFIPTARSRTLAQTPDSSEFLVDDFATGLEVTGIADGASESSANEIIRRFRDIDEFLFNVFTGLGGVLDLSSIESVRRLGGFGLDGQRNLDPVNFPDIESGQGLFGFSQRTTQEQLAAQISQFIIESVKIGIEQSGGTVETDILDRLRAAGDDLEEIAKIAGDALHDVAVNPNLLGQFMQLNQQLKLTQITTEQVEKQFANIEGLLPGLQLPSDWNADTIRAVANAWSQAGINIYDAETNTVNFAKAFDALGTANQNVALDIARTAAEIEILNRNTSNFERDQERSLNTLNELVEELRKRRRDLAFEARGRHRDLFINEYLEQAYAAIGLTDQFRRAQRYARRDQIELVTALNMVLEEGGPTNRERIRQIHDEAAEVIRLDQRLQNFVPTIQALKREQRELAFTDEDRFVAQQLTAGAYEDILTSEINLIEKEARALYRLQEAERGVNNERANYVARRFGTEEDLRLRADFARMQEAGGVATGEGSEGSGFDAKEIVNRALYGEDGVPATTEPATFTDPMVNTGTQAVATGDAVVTAMSDPTSPAHSAVNDIVQNALLNIETNTRRSTEYLEGFEVNGMRVRAS